MYKIIIMNFSNFKSTYNNNNTLIENITNDDYFGYVKFRISTLDMGFGSNFEDLKVNNDNITFWSNYKNVGTMYSICLVISGTSGRIEIVKDVDREVEIIFDLYRKIEYPVRIIKCNEIKIPDILIDSFRERMKCNFFIEDYNSREIFYKLFIVLESLKFEMSEKYFDNYCNNVITNENYNYFYVLKKDDRVFLYQTNENFIGDDYYGFKLLKVFSYPKELANNENIFVMINAFRSQYKNYIMYNEFGIEALIATHTSVLDNVINNNKSKIESESKKRAIFDVFKESYVITGNINDREKSTNIYEFICNGVSDNGTCLTRKNISKTLLENGVVKKRYGDGIYFCNIKEKQNNAQIYDNKMNKMYEKLEKDRNATLNAFRNELK